MVDKDKSCDVASVVSPDLKSLHFVAESLGDSLLLLSQ
jgi:hypothetical protein